ncbi:ribonuclease 3 [Drosophila grimshawi]|uniref:Ribonuclease 3 n=1 Tax=Drosophila grimshawi TaxID=7222 RepID=B4J860_DROGR|nr:ribonuclease 3 [Drosophila grimshawi]EDW01197.1 GH21300 [Drosophila grimshawi]
MDQPPLPPPQEYSTLPPPPPPPPPDTEHLLPPGVQDDGPPGTSDVPIAASNQFNYEQHPSSVNNLNDDHSSYANYMKYAAPHSACPQQSQPYAANSGPHSYNPYYYHEGYAGHTNYAHPSAGAYDYDQYGQSTHTYNYQERNRYEHNSNYRLVDQRYAGYNHSYPNNYGGGYNYNNNNNSRYEHHYHNPRQARTGSYPYARKTTSVNEDTRSYSKRSESDAYAPKIETERDRVLRQYCANYCEKSEDYIKKIKALNEAEAPAETWVRSSPAELYYERTKTEHEVKAKTRLHKLCALFDDELIQRAVRERQNLPAYEPPPRKTRRRACKHKHKSEACSSSSDSDSDEDAFKIEQDCCMEELSRKVLHPQRVHPDLWHNDAGEMNDGPLCRCSAKSRRIGIRHGIYPGEKGYLVCDKDTNNAANLYHYRITISPPTNFLTKTPTIIKHDEHEFLFEGFSLLSHVRLTDLPVCKVIRFNIEYTIEYDEEKMPENFTIRELDLFFKYLFHELLELVDFNLIPNGSANADDSCPAFHFLPRFVRELPDNGKEVLAMCEVLKYLLDNSAELVERQQLLHLNQISTHEWQKYVDIIKGMLVTKPGHKPCSLRVDQLDRNNSDLPVCLDRETGISHPAIVHFGIRPPQLSYAGNPEYQKAWREYVKFRHLMANMSKPSFKDKRKLEDKEQRLQEMRTQGRMKRNITVAISSEGFYRTGIMCDIVQHAMLIPVLTGHLRFHKSLDLLEESIGYKFKNRYLLQLALTHPSYKENYGTNPDHARNSLTNCGIRQPEYGDRKIHYMNTRKRGINTLVSIMSRFGKDHETLSNITHNERLEFLGDAVVEFLSSIHLFFMFPELEEGGLATYRAAIVQNQHLALLAKKLQLEEFMLYAHGSDLCHELELRHAMANCFEALMGALLLDGGIKVADEVFTDALFRQDDKLLKIWKNLPEHPLQEQEPLGDRSCIDSYRVLKDLTKFEDSVGIKFKHIRLLARAFTDRSIGFTHLTLGSNQRLEFLGDTVLQLICSEYLYRHFPEHHEGHLSLLRSSLVNNRTQAVVCDDLGMPQYAVYANPKADLKTKDRADLLEAFLGALYVDKGLLYCEQFCHVCLFPRLQLFIMNQDWNDPKSKLQQCCLTLRTMDGGEPDIPYYKVVEATGPTNTRVYKVAVYFRSKRLATASGSSIQQAEMNAAKQALENSRDLFPQLDHQKRVIAKSIKKQTGNEMDTEADRPHDERAKKPKYAPPLKDESHLPKQYRMHENISSDELPEDDEDDNDNTNKTLRSPVHVSRSRSRSSSSSSTSSDSDSATSTPPKQHPDLLYGSISPVSSSSSV